MQKVKSEFSRGRIPQPTPSGIGSYNQRPDHAAGAFLYYCGFFIVSPMRFFFSSTSTTQTVTTSPTLST